MRLGFTSTSFPDWSFRDLVEYAARAQFQLIELAVWPTWKRGPLVATHINCETATRKELAAHNKHLADAGVGISCFAYYANFLDTNVELRERVRVHMHRVIDVAADMGVFLIATSVGRDVTLSVEQNLGLLTERFDPIVDHALKRGVRLLVENCAMEGWDPHGGVGNIAFSPEIWKILFARYPPEVLGINFDPSHCIWLGMDVLATLDEAKARLWHVHAKDTVVDRDRLSEYGIHGRQLGWDPWDPGWWHFTIPGLGQVDWHAFINALWRAGYDGGLIVELEDPAWMTSDDRVMRALDISRNYLSRFLF